MAPSTEELTKLIKPTTETVTLTGEADAPAAAPTQSITVSRNPRKFLVAVDPLAKHGQSEKAIVLTRDISKAGDTVILASVLDELYLTDTVAIGLGYSSEYSNQTALDEQAKILKAQTALLQDIGRTFEKGVNVVIKVIYGGIESRLLHEAEANQVDFIVIGKRKLGRLEKLLTTSVSNYITSHAQTSVIVAK